MKNPRILIACVGNIFLGDDGFGTEVARQLAARPLPPEVALKDFGIRGLDLTYALLDPWELVILVDACRRGGPSGTVYLIEPEPEEEGESDAVSVPFEAHGMNPTAVLRAVHAMGVRPGRVLLVGCEPAWTGSGEDGGMGLSGPVQEAVDGAVAMIYALVSKTLSGELTAGALQPH